MPLNTRHKNGQWNLPTNDNGAIASWDYVKIAVLMDIRDELQTLNRLLGCSNFIRIPTVLDAISKNTKPKRKAAKSGD